MGGLFKKKKEEREEDVRPDYSGAISFILSRLETLEKRFEAIERKLGISKIQPPKVSPPPSFSRSEPAPSRVREAETARAEKPEPVKIIRGPTRRPFAERD
jgi:hypothetical protein